MQKFLAVIIKRCWFCKAPYPWQVKHFHLISFFSRFLGSLFKMLEEEMEKRFPLWHTHTQTHTSFLLINQKWLVDQSDCSDGVEFSVYSLERHERDARRTWSRSTLWKPYGLICIANFAHLLYWKNLARETAPTLPYNTIYLEVRGSEWKLPPSLWPTSSISSSPVSHLNLRWTAITSL